MVLKTVARRLEPWVPTSTEWRKEQMRAAQEVAAEHAGPAVIAAAPTSTQAPITDDYDEGPIEGELVD
jgi:recombination protein RecT